MKIEDYLDKQLITQFTGEDHEAIKKMISEFFSIAKKEETAKGYISNETANEIITELMSVKRSVQLLHKDLTGDTDAN